MLKTELSKRVSELSEENIGKLVDFMKSKGIETDKWSDITKASKKAVTYLNQYFGELAVGEATAPKEPPKVDFEEVKESQKNIEKENKIIDINKNKNKNETKAQMLKRYKTIDNLIDDVEEQTTEFEEVRRMSDSTYALYMTGSELVSMFLKERLCYDPTMQRGVKTNKKGETRATFSDPHVKDIYDSMIQGNFNDCSQIHLFAPTDDCDVEYDKDEESLVVTGKIRLGDGQHRVRALVLLHYNIVFDEIDANSVDLDDFVYNVVIHNSSADEARTVYINIDKNLKLDKSQARQLSVDPYAKVVNVLNQNADSDLRGKIATAKPVGSKLVLFSTMAEKLQENVEIETTTQRDEITQYLMEYFKYLASKLPEAFGNTDEKRIEFRKNNLLNENNFFPVWLKVAFLDKENYQKNIDVIIENKEKYNKDSKIEIDGVTKAYWETQTVVKEKTGEKATGYAMSNTSTATTNLIKFTLKLLGYNAE
jgi:hypothetical protein